MNIPEGFTEWVWSEDKPYPETLETKVRLIFRSGNVTNHIPEKVGWWWSEDRLEDNWFPAGDGADIIAYKVVEN